LNGFKGQTRAQHASLRNIRQEHFTVDIN